MKNYLITSKKTRDILDIKTPIPISNIEEGLKDTKSIKSKKDAIAIGAYWMAVARTHGDSIPKSVIVDKLNKLKGKNNRSSIEIRKELNKAANQIHNKEIKNILLGIDQSKMVSAIAETVITQFGSENVKKSITHENESHGWTKFGIALIIVLATKLFSRRKM